MNFQLRERILEVEACRRNDSLEEEKPEIFENGRDNGHLAGLYEIDGTFLKIGLIYKFDSNKINF